MKQVLLIALFVFTPTTQITAQSRPLERFAFAHGQMGTTFEIILYAPDSLSARGAAAAAFARVDTLNQRLSDYLIDSELSELSATSGSGRAVPVSDDLWDVLVAAQRVSEQSGGAFDVTVGPITRLWRWAMRRGTLPPADRLEDALGAVGYYNLVLNRTRQTVELTVPGMRLDLGGIAKGFAADEALAVVRAHGITRALVDAGGDIRLGEAPPGKPGWGVELSGVNENGELVQLELLLADVAIATSGATYRNLTIDGREYSHIVNPLTGIGLTNERLVTVIAPTGMQADALASAVSVLGTDDGLKLVARLPDVAAQVIDRVGNEYRLRKSNGFAHVRYKPMNR